MISNMLNIWDTALASWKYQRDFAVCAGLKTQSFQAGDTREVRSQRCDWAKKKQCNPTTQAKQNWKLDTLGKWTGAGVSPCCCSGEHSAVWPTNTHWPDDTRRAAHARRGNHPAGWRGQWATLGSSGQQPRGGPGAFSSCRRGRVLEVPGSCTFFNLSF